MQITLIKHGRYDKTTGHLTREGIEEGIGVGLVLGNAVNPKTMDFWDEIPVTEHTLQSPDLILTSLALQTKETGFAFLKQLKQFGIEPEVKNNIYYLNDWDVIREKVCLIDPIQKTINLIQRAAKEGKKHIVIISHKSNIQVLLNLLGTKNYAPQHGIAYTFLSVNPEKIGKEKYPLQIRNAKAAIADAYTIRQKGLSVLPVDYIEWHMPDYVFMDKQYQIKKARLGGKERE